MLRTKHLGCFQFLAMTNKTIMNILVIMNISLRDFAGVSTLIPVRISDLTTIDIFYVNKVYQIALQISCANLQLFQQYMAMLGVPNLGYTRY